MFKRVLLTLCIVAGVIASLYGMAYAFAWWFFTGLRF